MKKIFFLLFSIAWLSAKSQNPPIPGVIASSRQTGGTVLFLDTFTGTDNTNNLGAHTADVGTGTYSVAGATFGISTNRAYSTPSASGAGFITHANNGGSKDGTFQVDITTCTTAGRTDMSLGFRVTNSGNLLQLVLSDLAGGSALTLYKVASGAYTQLATSSLTTITPGTTHTIKAVCLGTQIDCYYDGTLKFTYNVSTPQDNAKGIGLVYFNGGSNNIGTGFWDNLTETN